MAYFELNIGSINYNFTKEQFTTSPGYDFQSVEVPHTAVRLVLFGYIFNKNLSAQITYMRPVYWVKYKYASNNIPKKASVWMNIVGLTGKAQLPLTEKISVFGEAGLGIITRLGGIGSEGVEIVKKANYSTVLLGGGLKYKLNPKIDLLLSSVYSPENKKVKQPATSFISAGFAYNLNPVSDEKIKAAEITNYIHPKHLFQVGYSSLILGYNINNSLSKSALFWGGSAEVNHGITIDYRQNVFHTAKYFSLDWGIGAGFYTTNINKESFFTISAYPIFRFNFLHTKPIDAYLYYSVAGPSFISKTLIDGFDGGGKFTFQDNMGLGFYLGNERHYNLEFKIGHYSNGNIFTNNAGVKIPLSINLGYTF
ncbi:acyloxyacyl hydrolase [Halpernia sp.]|uniref:acyloxyacyl hydrolase n=1 Tax=Halpernia sp. TaxID=2782209 RepID=UPI003A903351